MSVDERRGPADPRTRPIITAGRVEQVGSGFPDWSPNLLDYRHSVVVAMKRAERDDETLEICAHCECEVDVTPAPHRPGCPGIGKPRASSASATSRITVANEARREAVRVQARADVEGLDLLERMDDGEPLGRQVVDHDDEEPAEEGEPEHRMSEPPAAAEDGGRQGVPGSPPEPALEEVAAATTLSPETGAAEGPDLLLREPGRPAASPSTAGMELYTGRRARRDQRGMGEALEAVLGYLQEGPLRLAEIARREELPQPTVWKTLDQLVKKGHVVKVGRGLYAAAAVEKPTVARLALDPDPQVAHAWIRVPGTGLAYRDADEAAAAAAEVQADGLRVYRAAAADGDTRKAHEALGRAGELAAKIRAAAGLEDSSREGAVDLGSAEGPRSPKPGIGERDDQQQEMRAPTPAATGDRAGGPGGSTPAPGPEAASRALVVAALAAARAFADALERELAA